VQALRLTPGPGQRPRWRKVQNRRGWRRRSWGSFARLSRVTGLGTVSIVKLQKWPGRAGADPGRRSGP